MRRFRMVVVLGTTPNGFELKRLRPQQFRRASPERREASQTTMPARPISVRICFIIIIGPRCQKGPVQGQIMLDASTAATLCNVRPWLFLCETMRSLTSPHTKGFSGNLGLFFHHPKTTSATKSALSDISNLSNVHFAQNRPLLAILRAKPEADEILRSAKQRTSNQLFEPLLANTGSQPRIDRYRFK